jgi:hypothetical protein
MEKVSTFGKMEENIMENGKTTIWKALVYISGQMEEGMKANIKTIKNVDMVFTTGLMVENMRVGGTKVSSMVSVPM